jgi:acyl-coenzyme A synthetase/AMP-(fatty) acid ligase
MHRTRLHADPHGRFVHDVILDSCRRFAHHKQPRKIRFADAVPRTSSGKIQRRELKIMVLEQSGEGFERTSSPRPSC